VVVISAGILNSFTPFFYKLFVEALPSLDSNRLLNILFVYIGFRIAGLIFNILSYPFGSQVVFGSSSAARTEVFNRVQDLDFAFHAQKSIGSLISAVKRGDGAYFNIFHTIHFRIINVVIEFIVMSAFLTSIDTRIGLAIMGSVAALLLTVKFTIGYNMKTRARFNDAEDDVSAVIVDNFINYETVKLFAQEMSERSRLAAQFKIWMRRLWEYEMSFRFIDVSVGAVMTAGIFATLYTALRLATSGELTVGEFVLIAGFTASFYPQMFELVFALREIAKNFVDIKRYFELLEEEILVKDTKNPKKLKRVKGEINFDDVYFSYKGGQKNALHGVTLKIKEGQSVALVGRSGSGKTTMIKALLRFYDIEKGKITIDGININKFTKTQLRSFMGVVPQEPILFSMRSIITNTIG